MSDPYSEVESSLTEWERNKEREEFARTTQVYSRLSHSISSRFAKAESSEAANLDIVVSHVVEKRSGVDNMVSRVLLTS